MIQDCKIKEVVSGVLKSCYGLFTLYQFEFLCTFDSSNNTNLHLALVKDDVNTASSAWKNPVLCRINSACMTSEVFNCQRCDCKWQLESAIKLIADEGRGIITYHPSHEGCGYGLAAKLMSFNLIDSGIEPGKAYRQMGFKCEDVRDYRPAANILHYFGIEKVKLLGNNSKKAQALEDCGIRVIERCPLVYDKNNNQIINYLNIKAQDSSQELLRKHLKLNPDEHF